MRESALRILTRREHSAAQLRRKLTQRGFDGGTVSEVVERLSETDLLSETRFAENLARSRARKGYGPLRIRAELKEARVPDADISAAIGSLDCDFEALAEEARAAKFRERPGDAGSWQKQYQFLQRRGFEPEQIRAALSDPPEC